MPDDRAGPIPATGAAVLCVLLIALVVHAARRRRRRSEQFRTWAQANGWTCTERPPVNWGRRLPGGNRKGVAVALSGRTRGRPVTDVQTSNGTVADTRFYVVVVIRVLRPLPDLEVESRAGLARLIRGRALLPATRSSTGRSGYAPPTRPRSRPGARPR